MDKNNLFPPDLLELGEVLAEIGEDHSQNPLWYASSVSSRCPGFSDLWERVAGLKEEREKLKPWRIFRCFLDRFYKTWLVCPPRTRRIQKSILNQFSGDMVFISWYVRRNWNKDRSFYRDICWQSVFDQMEDQKRALTIFHGIPDERDFEKCFHQQERKRFAPNNPEVLPLDFFIRPRDVYGRLDDSSFSTHQA